MAIKVTSNLQKNYYQGPPMVDSKDVGYEKNDIKSVQEALNDIYELLTSKPVLEYAQNQPDGFIIDPEDENKASISQKVDEQKEVVVSLSGARNM